MQLAVAPVTTNRDRLQWQVQPIGPEVMPVCEEEHL